VSVGLYLMTEKGVAVLDAALASGVEIAHVTTAPAAGMADDSHHKLMQRAKAESIPAFLRAHPPTYAGTHSIAAGWRWMLDVPNLVVAHDSLLPRYRGFSPLITALINGDPEVGVTAFLAETEPDTGPVIAQRRLPVAYPARMREILDRLVPLYHDLAVEVCATLAAGDPLRYAAQDHARRRRTASGATNTTTASTGAWTTAASAASSTPHRIRSPVRRRRSTASLCMCIARRLSRTG
jgi:methionyl-tRNA formyltransferase